MSNQVAWLRAQIEGDRASAERREGPTVWFDDETIDRCNAELAILDKYEELKAASSVSAMTEDRYWLVEEVVELLVSGYRRRPGYARIGA